MLLLLLLGFWLYRFRRFSRARLSFRSSTLWQKDGFGSAYLNLSLSLSKEETSSYFPKSKFSKLGVDLDQRSEKGLACRIVIARPVLLKRREVGSCAGIIVQPWKTSTCRSREGTIIGKESASKTFIWYKYQ